ncbi:hypothetical protein ABPG72_002564 [Tetrahymena utriculariae]
MQQSFLLSQSKQEYSPSHFIKDYILTPKISQFSKSPTESNHQLINKQKPFDLKTKKRKIETFFGKYLDTKCIQHKASNNHEQSLNQSNCPYQTLKFSQQNMLNFSFSVKDGENSSRHEKENNQNIKRDKISCFSDYFDKEAMKSENDECKQNSFFQNSLKIKQKKHQKNKLNFLENIGLNQEQLLSEVSQIDLLDQQKLSRSNYQYQERAFQVSTEWIFHQGIQAALKQFILNTNQKISIYLSQKNQLYTSYSKRLLEINKIKQYHTYLLFITDKKLEITNQLLFQELCKLLSNLNIELLVLFLNQNQAIEEFSLFNNVFIDQKSVVIFFNSEQKLLQYIYSQREHVKNYLLPMIFEHF